MRQFQKTCQIPLAEALVNVHELNLQQKKSKAEIKRERREQYRRSKNQIEEEWKDTAIVRLAQDNLK